MEIQELITKWQERKKEVLKDYQLAGEQFRNINAAINVEITFFLQDLEKLHSNPELLQQ